MWDSKIIHWRGISILPWTQGKLYSTIALSRFKLCSIPSRLSDVTDDGISNKFSSHNWLDNKGQHTDKFHCCILSNSQYEPLYNYPMKLKHKCNINATASVYMYFFPNLLDWFDSSSFSLNFCFCFSFSFQQICFLQNRDLESCSAPCQPPNKSNAVFFE